MTEGLEPRKRVIVKIVQEVKYASKELPINLITSALRVVGVRANDGIATWDVKEGSIAYVCRTIYGIGCIVDPQHVVEITDKHQRFAYYMNGPYIDVV